MTMSQTDIGFLVVDDDAFMLKIIRRTLDTLGYDRVSTCASGAEALAKLSSDAAPEVILCDLNMPEMDGIEFVRKLASLGYRGSIVVISGEDKRILATVENLARAHRLDILGFIEKPLKAGALQEVLARRSLHTVYSTPAPKTTGSIGADEVRLGLNAGEFMVYFQPKVEIASRWVSGVEALARWRHPSRGMIAPDNFIPVAEQHGLIGALTDQVMNAALRQAGVWRQQGIELKVAVNVSMSDLTDLDFPEKVLACVESACIRPFDVTLEVTESSLMRNPLVPLDILTRLRLKRVSLSIDDFGTGYSNLSQLQNIPFDELKLDRSFIQGAARNPASHDILESSVELAKKLNMTVVAEGVETLDDWDLVARLGCDLAQGYLIARPMPADEFPSWLARWRKSAGH